MAHHDRPFDKRTFPWWQSGFDLEGVVGFLAGCLLGLLLGMLWGPLFFIGLFAGLGFLFATRSADRVTPSAPSLVVAPCDGVVVSVDDEDPPAELRMPAGARRIRISSSPLSTNPVYAPVSGTIDYLVREEGRAEAFMAARPDTSGLALLYVTIGGDAGRAGLRVATGGLGPRLEARSDAGDHVSAGKVIATRRLGGWCDLYLPEDVAVLVEPGRTLIGGESLLGDLGDSSPSAYEAPQPAFEAEDPTPETVPPSVAEDVEHEVGAEEAPPTPETAPPEIAADATVEETEDDEDSRDPAKMFARLRRKASSLKDDDETPGKE